jgi:hypothetical protein
MRARRGPGGGRAWGGGGASGMLGEGPTQGLWGQGTRGAHVEHLVHVRDLGGVKAQRLIERHRVLPSRREGHAMRGEARAGRREGVGRRRKRHARGKARFKAVGDQGTRGAHPEHAGHVRDLRGVKAQRLIEGPRVLPSRKGRAHAMRGEVRARRREGVGRRRRKRHARGKARSTRGLWGPGHARSAR